MAAKQLDLGRMEGFDTVTLVGMEAVTEWAMDLLF
jgi:hypothetical protein